MEKYRKIVNFIKKSKSIITAKDFKNNDIGYYYINKLVEDNYIKRISPGIYGKTEVTPNQIEIAILREYNISSFDKEIKQHYINKDYLYLGAIKIKSPYGNNVICYNLERTICDIVKNECSLDKE